MTFGPSRPNITENKANMGRLVEARRASEAPEETSTERKEISPELKARLLAFDNAAHEYVMFMHDYYDKKDALWENSDREDELFSAEYISQNGDLAKLLQFLRIEKRVTEEDREDLAERGNKVAVQFIELHKALDSRKQELEDAVNAYSDLFEDPLEVAYLSALDNVIGGKPQTEA